MESAGQHATGQQAAGQQGGGQQGIEIAGRPGESAGQQPVLVALRRVSVSYGDLLALSDVSLELRLGEIHCIVGENGAGKSTLMHVVAGLVKPTSGGVEWPEARAGACVVFQKLMLVERLSGYENILLGQRRLPYRLGSSGLRAHIEHCCSEWGLDIALDRVVEAMSGGERQRVALARALLQHAPVLILDEPTALLSGEEVASLFRLLRHLRQHGVGIFFIGHKLPEVMALADRISVLHRGRLVADGVLAHEVDGATLASMMVGGEGAASEACALEAGTEGGTEVGTGSGAGGGTGGGTGGATEAGIDVGNGLPEGQSAPTGAGDEPALELCDVVLDSAGAGINLRLRRGQILGVAGIAGNGQKALVEVASGLRKPVSGSVRTFGVPMTAGNVQAFLAAGVGYLTEDRHLEGCHPALRVWEAVAVRLGLKPAKGALTALSRRQLKADTEAILTQHEVVASGTDALVSSLSGGNLQKLLLGRELKQQPKVLVVHEPTQGLDLRSTAKVRRRLKEMSAMGCAVLLVSSDLDEVLELSDEVVVLSRGRVAGRAVGPEYDRVRIGQWMAGLD